MFLTGSYKTPREFNWVVGVILLMLTLLLSFTGYLLPWDQLALWAVTNRLDMAPRHSAVRSWRPVPRGLGRQPDLRRARLYSAAPKSGQHTLLRFYILHCIFFPPLVATIFMAVHFWRIRRDGMSGPL